ncbi:ATP-binding cassette domain-containing protein [Actinoplanes sp. NPDC023936]|uniref:ABC transporter ATP-binding protein n=1 Tax=Actinoplanes sp. NPDC023936 TaxID=3154910 RepID=UPI0033F6D3FE
MSLLSIVNLSKAFKGVTVLDGVSLTIGTGEIAGLVGESGSGKSTLIRCLMGLEKPDGGAITYDGIDLLRAGRAERRRFQREAQIVFQDPYSSLNPRRTVEQIVGEGLQIHEPRAPRRDRVVEALDQVGLGADMLGRHPGSLSGGQRQRVAIARALAMRPRLLVCDEPVSALDVSVQAQVVHLLKDAQQRLGTSLLFVAHDLAVVGALCDTVTVLDQGVAVEQGVTAAVFAEPAHAYTRELLAAVPDFEGIS